QQWPQPLAERATHGSATVTLRPAIRQRILTALEYSPAANPHSLVCLWSRFARPLRITASLLLIATFLAINFFSGARVHETKTVRSNGRDIHPTVSIDLSYRVPTHKFRKEGNLVVDTLSYETIVANGTLWTGGPERVQEK